MFSIVSPQGVGVIGRNGGAITMTIVRTVRSVA